MGVIQTQEDLLIAIVRLEKQETADKVILEKNFQDAYGSIQQAIQPVNILKNALTEISNSDTLKKDMLRAAVALSIGYVTKKIVESFAIKNNSPAKAIAGTALQLVFSGLIANNAALIKRIAIFIYKRFMDHRKQQPVLVTAEQI